MKEKKSIVELFPNGLPVVLKTLIEDNLDLGIKIRKRCLIEGCRYGMFEGDKVKDCCIYCKETRRPAIFVEKAIFDELNNFDCILPVKKND